MEEIMKAHALAQKEQNEFMKELLLQQKKESEEAHRRSEAFMQ